MPLTIGDSDASGAEKKEVSYRLALSDDDELPTDAPAQVDDTATAILKKKKKPNSLM